MFGIKYAKYSPGYYVFKFYKGKLASEGDGLSFFYYAPFTSIVVIKTGSADAGFIFSEKTSDFQEVSIQGQITYRVVEPKKTVTLLNFSVDRTGRYVTDDPEKLQERLITLAQVSAKEALKSLPLKEAITASDRIASLISGSLANNTMVSSLGLEILDVSVTAVRPDPDTARALEAATREQILKESDDAVFLRRNAAVENERVIRENEMETDIAVGLKNREINAIEMESRRVEQENEQALAADDLRFKIEQEEKTKELVELQSVNQRKEADNKGYAVSAILKAYQGAGREVIELLANTNLDSSRLIALAFQDIAGKAEKIGQLNITPDLLAAITHNKRGA